MTDSIILAGGLGSRLRRAIGAHPKILAPINDRPFIELQFEWLLRNGVRRAFVAAGFRADEIVEFLNDYPRSDLTIKVIVEQTPLGTGGALRNALAVSRATGPVLVINGDTYFRFDITAPVQQHVETKAWMTLIVAAVPNAHRFGTVGLDGNTVTGFTPASGREAPGLVSAGAYVVTPEQIPSWPSGSFSLEQDLLPRWADTGNLRAYVVPESEAFTDIGTVPSYYDFCDDRARVPGTAGAPDSAHGKASNE